MSKPLETVEAPALARKIEAGYEKRLMITAGRASRELGGKIADKLNVELIDAGLKTFADGEVYCRYGESGSSPSRPGTRTRARTRSRPRASPSRRASWRTRSRSPESTGS